MGLSTFRNSGWLWANVANVLTVTVLVSVYRTASLNVLRMNVYMLSADQESALFDIKLTRM